MSPMASKYAEFFFIFFTFCTQKKEKNHKILIRWHTVVLHDAKRFELQMQ